MKRSKRSKRQAFRRELKLTPDPTPVPIQADEFICLPAYVPEPVPVESAKPWYRFGH